MYAGGMVDGPGIRTVVFFSGCSLRCKYCHNPDTWFKKRGKIMTVAEVLEEVKKYKSYYKFSGGGITISGGEPMDQPDFLHELLLACRENGIHTTLDTSGCATPDITNKILPLVDLLMLDFKTYNPKQYTKITGQPLDRVLSTLEIAESLNTPTSIRYVLVPNLTDDHDDLSKMAAYLKQHKCIQKITVLPFHKEGEYKWKDLNLNYELHDTKPPSPQLVKQVQKLFE
jgi:pyruvate formate lyase activating enzyme